MTQGLDTADSLKPGHGRLNLWVGALPEGAQGGVNMEARINKILSGYAAAEASWTKYKSWDWQASTGLRLKW